MKTAHRYILREVLPLFGITVAALTFVFLLNKVFLWMDLVLNKGVPFWDVLLLYVSIVPFFLAVTVPMSALVATLLALGRLASDMEVTAFKSSGIHLLHLMAPVVGFGLVLTALMILFNDRVLPASNFLFKKVSYRIVRNQAHVAIKERVFIDQFEGCRIYIDSQGKEGLLEGIKVFMKRSSEPLQTILAKTGRLVTDPETLQVYLMLNDGMMITTGADGFETHNRLLFKRYLYHLNLSNSLANLSSVKKDFMEMNLGELLREIDATTDDPPRRQRLMVEFQKRISLPFACLVVTWLSATLGLWFRRGGFLAFAYGVLLVFIYYLLFVLGEAMSLKKGLDPVVGTWTANAVFALVGLLMYRVVILERSSYRWLAGLFRRRRSHA